MGLENPLHLLIIAVVLLMVFGAKRLPEMGRSLGSGLHGFKDALQSGASGNELSAATTSPVTAARDAEHAPVA